MGVPSPAAAIGAVMPIVFSFSFDVSYWKSTPLFAVWMLTVAFLAISTLPTISSKGLNRKLLPKGKNSILLVVVLSLVTVWGFMNFWTALQILFVIYMTSLPIIYAYFKYKNKTA
jgi:CDP-diacylglycerol--serine O-phosphatidyltransferase